MIGSKEVRKKKKKKPTSKPKAIEENPIKKKRPKPVDKTDGQKKKRVNPNKQELDDRTMYIKPVEEEPKELKKTTPQLCETEIIEMEGFDDFTAWSLKEDDSAYEIMLNSQVENTSNLWGFIRAVISQMNRTDIINRSYEEPVEYQKPKEIKQKLTIDDQINIL